MNEIKIANYTLLGVLLLIMASFCISMSTLSKTNSYGDYPSIISGYNR